MKMAIGNPRIHMICGICGCNKELTFKVDPKGDYDDDNDMTKPSVSISCGNCGSLTWLDEIIDETEIKWTKRGEIE